MQQSKFVKKAKKIVKEHPGAFEALLDFERTGRVRSKTRANFTIDKILMKKFREYCREKHLNMSGLVEDFIRKKVIQKES